MNIKHGYSFFYPFFDMRRGSGVRREGLPSTDEDEESFKDVGS